MKIQSKDEKAQIRKKFRSAHDIPKVVNTSNNGKSKTQQQFKQEADIYNVLAKHTRGLPISVNPGTPQYLDVSEIDPNTHQSKIDKIKKHLDEQNEKMQKLQKEEMEKQENEQFEKYKKRHDELQSQPSSSGKHAKSVQSKNERNDND